MLVIIIDIGNIGRRISREGKIKIFKNGDFIGINQNAVKDEIKTILRWTNDKGEETMLCKICSTEETDNPDGICDDCKFCILDNKDIPPNI